MNDAEQALAVERGCALITGGARGIGAAAAEALAADGWAVGVNYRVERERAEAVVARIVAGGGEAVALRADVCDPGAAERGCILLEQAMQRPILVLVNNAGTVRYDLLPVVTDADWEVVVGTNLTAPFRLTRRVLVSMMRERFGRIINIASAGALRSYPGQAPYNAAKAGLIALTKTTAREVARTAVTVNAVVPGVIDTDATTAGAEVARAEIPARRPGTPEEVAACVSFLASERAGYVTGSVLTCDGGLTA